MATFIRPFSSSSFDAWASQVNNMRSKKNYETTWVAKRTASQVKLTMYDIENYTKRIMTTQPFLNSLLFTTQLKMLKMKQIWTLFCSSTLFLNVQCNQYFKNEQFKNYSRIFKDAGKYSRTTTCCSRINNITSFDSYFKNSSWRSRTSGNLKYIYLYITQHQGRIQPVRLGGPISKIFGSEVSLRIHYCKRDEVYLTTLLWQNNGLQNGLTSWMLYSELYKFMVNEVTFVGFRGGGRSPKSSPSIRPC